MLSITVCLVLVLLVPYEIVVTCLLNDINRKDLQITMYIFIDIGIVLSVQGYYIHHENIPI